jgi:hypothetical protein
VKDHAMGLGNHGDHPIPPAQTRRPCASIPGSDHDVAARIVPGGAGIAAQFDLVGVRASALAGPVCLSESPGGSSAMR